MIKKISSYIIVLAIGAAVGTYFDAKHTIEEKVVYKDRVRTVTREIITERPDGTKVTERVVDKNEKKTKKISKKESKPSNKNWAVSVMADLSNPVGPARVYSVEVHRRVFRNLYGSVYGRTDGAVGVGVTLFF